MARNDSYTPILTITGSDSTGGSGIQADIKTISALGGYAVSAVTSVTVQNTLGIQNVFDLPAEIVGGQIEAIIEDMEPAAVKIGMVRSVAVVDAVATVLQRHASRLVVYDPAIVSTRGEVLMPDDVVAEVRDRFFPLSTIVMIKKEAAAYILRRKIQTTEEMVQAATELLKSGSRAVLLQGGQITPDTTTDVLVQAGVAAPTFFSSAGAIDWNTHGVGGTLSSAIATFLGEGETIASAVERAKNYINQLIVYSVDLHIGHGGNLLDHSWQEAQSEISPHLFDLYNRLMNEISAHYKTCNDVRFYADRLHVTSRYLAQITKRIAGKSPKSLIHEYQMKEIEVRLGSSTKNVQEIAFEFGFSSQAHFTKFFKRMKGCSPSEFRVDSRKG